MSQLKGAKGGKGRIPPNKPLFMEAELDGKHFRVQARQKPTWAVRNVARGA